MKPIYRSNLFILSSSLMIFFFVITGCSPVEIKKVTVQNTDSYKFTTQNAGLRISVDPYKEENRLVEYFGCDLLSRGVLPVLVVIENQNAEDGYILLKEKSALMKINPTQTDTENNLLKGDYNSKELRNAITVENINMWIAVGGGLILPVAAIPAIFGGIVSAKGKMDEFAIKRNIEANHLLDKTIYQGASHSGFLYFLLKSKEDINSVKGLYLSMKNLRSGEITSFIININ
jgi:hypothetical protein